MNRLKELRTARGITQDELGAMLGVQKAAICKYETGRVALPNSCLVRLVEIFSVSADYILGRDDVTPLPKRMREKITASPKETNVVPVPLVGMVHAGEPMLAEECIQEYIPVSAGEVYDGDYFFMEVVGDCMLGDHIVEGAVVLVKRENEMIDNRIYVVRIGDEVLLRRIKRIKRSVALIPSNNAYDPMILSEGDIHVVGRVVEARMRF